jgi:hypothetical protein
MDHIDPFWDQFAAGPWIVRADLSFASEPDLTVYLGGGRRDATLDPREPKGVCRHAAVAIMRAHAYLQAIDPSPGASQVVFTAVPQRAAVDAWAAPFN